MELWPEIVAAVVALVSGLLGQELRWRRRTAAREHQQRQLAYERLLSVSDLTFSAARELAELKEGLHWWNGSSRLRVMKGTKLDERMLELSEEFARAVNIVKLYGSPGAVAAAEEMLAAVAAPLLEPGVNEDQLQRLKDRREIFVNTVRREQGSLELESMQETAA